MAWRCGGRSGPSALIHSRRHRHGVYDIQPGMVADGQTRGRQNGAVEGGPGSRGRQQVAKEGEVFRHV